MTSAVKIPNENIAWFLQEFANADDEQLEDGGCEIYGEDAQGREGSCFVKTQEICEAAANRIKELEEQNRQLTKAVEEEIDNRVSLLQKQNASLLEERQYWKDSYDQTISDLHSVTAQSRDGFARDFKGFISLDIHEESEVGAFIYPLLDEYINRKDGE
jgi:FtsZ-binding cell division protein ZapB